MKYRVVPFVASIASKDGAQAAASQLEQLINQMSGEGWEYVRLESVETHVAGSKGCFGLGATPGTVAAITMAVFRQ